LAMMDQNRDDSAVDMAALGCGGPEATRGRTYRTTLCSATYPQQIETSGTSALMSDSINSICCGFVVQLVV